MSCIGDGTPMFSKDIDLRGTRLAAKAVVQALKCEGVIVKGFVSVTPTPPPWGNQAKTCCGQC